MNRKEIQYKEIKEDWNDRIQQYKEKGLYKEVGESLNINDRFFIKQCDIGVEILEEGFPLLRGKIKLDPEGFYKLEVPWTKLFEKYSQFNLKIVSDIGAFISYECFVIFRQFIPAEFDTTILVNSLITEDPSPTGYYRVIFPFTQRSTYNWGTLINSISFMTHNKRKKSSSWQSAICLEDADGQFLIYKVQTEKDYLIFIDSEEKTSCDKFIKNVDNLILSLSFFLCTDFSNLGKLIITDTNKDFQKPSVVRSLPNNGAIHRMGFPLIHSSIWHLTEDLTEREKWDRYCVPISTKVIINLYHEISKNKDCANAIRMILNGCGRISLFNLLQLFVTLEVVAKWDGGENSLGQDEKVPDNIRELIISEIESILNKEKSEGKITQDQKNIVFSRIRNSFGPSNRGLLIGTFISNQILLNKYEKDIINHRNTILHGGFYPPNMINKTKTENNEISNLIFVFNALNSLLYRY